MRINKIGQLLHILLCVSLVFLNIKFISQNKIFKKLSNDTLSYVVIVLKTDEANSVEELNHSSFGYMTNNFERKSHHLEHITSKLSKKLHHKIVPTIYDTHKETVLSLLNSDVRSLIIPKSSYDDFEKV